MATLRAASWAVTSPSLLGEAAFALRVGRRLLTVRRDTRQRYTPTHPIVSFYPGAARGTLEILFARKWSILLSTAHGL